MKLSFWFLFAYLAISVVAQVIGHVNHWLLIGVVDVVYLAAILTNRSYINLWQSLLILLIFAAWNDSKSIYAPDFIADLFFLAIGTLNIFLLATEKRINIFSKDRKITDL